MGKLFGTDGVRGKANVFPITAEFATKLARALSQTATNMRKVAICRDTRISGEMLEAALIAGFTSQNIDVVNLGVVPTPIMASITPFLMVDYSIVISASHNPYYDNGIKILNTIGGKLKDAETSLLEETIEKENFGELSDKMGRVFEDKLSVGRYVTMVEGMLGNKQVLKGLRVVIDCANGAFSEIMPEVFKNLGAGVITIGNEPDGYNINKECGSTSIAKMADTVVNSNAHLGIAVDGDGDRIMVCDEKGNKIDGDQLIAFLGKYFYENKKLKANTVVATIVSNPGLGKFLSTLGVECLYTPVGERYVVEKMEEIGANVGGEESGHMVLSDYAKTGDGLVIGLVVADGLLRSGKKMSEMFPVFEPMPKCRVDVKFDDNDKKNAAFEAKDFKDAIKAAEARIENKGRVLVRKSGTEPKIQVWVWGEDEDFIKEVNASMVSVLEKNRK